MTDLAGGSRGIGAAIVRRFAADGARVAFTYLGSQDAALALTRATGAEAHKVDSADREALIRAIAGRGALDIIVISAGVLVFADPLGLDPNAVDHLIDVNVPSRRRAACPTAAASLSSARSTAIVRRSPARPPTRSASRPCRAWRATLATAVSQSTPSSPATDTDMNPASGALAETTQSFMAIKRHIRPSEIAD